MAVKGLRLGEEPISRRWAGKGCRKRWEGLLGVAVVELPRAKGLDKR